MKQQILATGAEAILIRQEDKLIKRRIKKNYRIEEIDEKLRKLRTRAESKIMGKLQDKINVPKILKADEKTKEIFMQFIEGKRLSEHLDDFGFKKQLEICKEIGKETGKIHNENIIHGDLTTSNMILQENKENKIFFIDFGLSFHSSRIEDKAVDLHLLRQALEAKHFQHWEKLFKSVLSGYETDNKEKILKQLEKVEKRGRYKH